MGQYYYVVNLDKKQYLHPHRMGDGLKLLEFGSSGEGTMLGLAILLADGNGRGGGDLHTEHPIVGSWAGDRIVIAGDYADPERFIPEDTSRDTLQEIANKAFSEDYQQPERVNLYTFAGQEFEEISDQVREAISADPYIKLR